MANTIKPNTFPQNSLPLQGTEEMYSQTGGVNTKFSVDDVWDGVPQTTITVETGTTIVNNDTVNVSGGTIMVISGDVVITSGVTTTSGSTSTMTDNGNGYFTHESNGTPNAITTIKPADYSLSEIKTGELWIDGKDIYRNVFQLPQWTSVANSSGNFLLHAGDYFDNIVRLDMFGEATLVKTIALLNIGDGTSWTGEAYIEYNGINSFITWTGIIDTSDAYNGGNAFDITLILEYTKK